MRYGRRRFGRSRSGYVRCSRKSVWRGMQAFSWKACSEMSSARPVGCGRRRLAILAHGPQQALLGRGDWNADALRDIVRDYVVEQLADDGAVLVIAETGFSSRAKRHAEWRGNTLVLQARSRTARSASSLPTFRVMAMRSSTARCIFRRNSPTIQIVWKPHTYLPTLALRPNQSLRRE